MSLDQIGAGYQNFLAWIGTQQPELLPDDKFKMFQKLLTAPIETNELTGRIFLNLKRVFSANDKVIKVQFSNDKDSEDFDQFFQNSFFENVLWEKVRSEIDSVLVINQPEQVTTPPEPMMEIVDIDRVKVIENDMEGNTLLIAFTGKIDGKDKLFVYDDANYARFDYSSGDIGSQPEVLVSHGLDYCPAHQIWSDRIESGNYINRRGPVTSLLSKLDWLLFHKTAKKYMDISNSYPVTVAFEEDKSSDNFRGEQPERHDSRKSNAGSNLVGPGSFVTVPPPREGEQSLIDAVRLISPDVTTLQHHIDEENRLMDYVFKSAVGFEAQDKEAMNVKQVDSIFESRKDVLLGVAKNLENIHKWCIDTCCTIRYGSSYVGCTVSYGSEFHLYSTEDLLEKYASAKQSGASEAILESYNQQLLIAQYGNYSGDMNRARIISDIDPFPGKSLDEILKVKDSLDPVLVLIKFNLVGYIRRFEREEINIVTFGEKTSYSKKIDTIILKLKEYATESLPGQQGQQA